jgi:ribose transport system ATP-binding protein
MSDEAGASLVVVAVKEAQPGLRLRGIDKSYGSHRVLSDVDLTVLPGEIVGLVGPNGAGKSTLVKIIDGALLPDGGEVSIDGASGRAALQNQVAILHQDPGLFGALSVLDNLTLTTRSERARRLLAKPWIDVRSARSSLAKVGLRVSVDTTISDLDPGAATMVAVARTLAQASPRAIVFDEVTAALPQESAEWLLDELGNLREIGISILIISHRLEEIVRIADHVVVLIDGKVTTDLARHEVSEAGLELLLGAARDHSSAPTPSSGQQGDRPTPASPPGDASTEPVVSLDAVSTDMLRSVSLAVRPGETVVVTGSLGSGLFDIAYIASGHQRPTSGSVTWGDNVRTGIVPPDRDREGLFPDMCVRENLSISSLPRVVAAKILWPHRELGLVRPPMASLAIVPNSTEILPEVLSGGNRQKLLFGRLLLSNPDLLILCEPSRGVDVRTRSEIHSLISDAADRGAAVVVLTTDQNDLRIANSRHLHLTAGEILSDEPAAI